MAATYRSKATAAASSHAAAKARADPHDSDLSKPGTMTEAAASDIRLHRGTLSDDEIERRLLKAIRELGGTVTEVDLMVRTGISGLVLEPVFRRLVEERDCRIEVDDEGALTYHFSPKIERRIDPAKARMERIKRALWRGFKAFFKVMIMVVLVGYFTLFVVLIIAAFIALFAAKAAANEDSDIDFGGGGRSHGGGFNPFFIWWMFGDADYRRHRHPNRRFQRWAGDEDWDGKRSGKDKRPFYKKVYSFVFGPEDDEIDELVNEQELLAWIRSERGVVSPTELTARTGWPLSTAESESTRLLAEFGGDVEISSDGSTLYAFEDVAQARTETYARPIPAFWERWEQKEVVTGNSTGANVGIAFLNAFVLFSSAYLMPNFLGPVLGFDLSSPGVWFALLGFPLFYSVTFFSVPLLRWLARVRPDNKARARRNIRRAVLRHIFAYSRSGAKAMREEDVVSLVERKLPDSPILPKDRQQAIREVFQEAVMEFGASVDIDEQANTVYRFERIADELAASDARRAGETNVKKRRLGDAFAAFDEALERGMSIDEAREKVAHTEAVEA